MQKLEVLLRGIASTKEGQPVLQLEGSDLVIMSKLWLAPLPEGRRNVPILIRADGDAVDPCC